MLYYYIIFNFMKYRIKTEEEFIKEFGENWKHKVGWNYLSGMGYLLGINIEVDYKIDFDNDSFYDVCLIDNWHITVKMITKLKKVPDYKPRKLIKNGEF